MGFFSQLFHPGGAYKNAEKPLKQRYNESVTRYNQAQGYNQPTYARGNTAAQTMMEQMNKLMNPGAMENEWANSYEKSPYAQNLQNEAQEGGMNAANAMGLGGSSAALSNIQNSSAHIMQEDRDKYMKDMMEKYMAGLGLGQNTQNLGANAGQNMGQNAMTQGNNAITQGQNEAGIEYNKYNAGPNMFTGGMGAIAKMIEAYLSGGGTIPGMPKTGGGH